MVYAKEAMVESEHVHILMDQSASMSHMNRAAYDGVLEIVDSLPDDASVCMSTFATTVALGTVCSKQEALERLGTRPTPAGTTSLYDAIGEMVIFERTRIHEGDGQPGRLVVVTDGMDTASRSHTRASVQRLMDENPDIRVTFLGANQDAVVEAQAIGIPVARALTFGASSEGVVVAMRSLSMSMARERRGMNADFTPSERHESMA